MRNQLTGNKAGAAAIAVGAGAALILVGCSSSGSSTTTPTAAPTSAAPTSTGSNGALPGPPSGSKQISTAPDGQATYTSYSTSQAPTAVTSYYDTSLKAAGYTVSNTGSGGGGWGQYGGSGSTLEANNSSTFVAVNAGGKSGGTTYFEVCSGPSSAVVDSCQQNNHGSSQSS